MAHTVEVPINGGFGLVYSASVRPLTPITSAGPGVHIRALHTDGESACFELSGTINWVSRFVICRYLEDLGVHRRAHNAIVDLICNVYNVDDDESSEEILAHVYIEVYYEESEYVVGLSVEDHGLRPTKASRDQAMEALAKVTIGLDDTMVMSSAVCLDEFSNGLEAMKTPCSHVFHGDCIGRGLEKRVTCPLCHFELSSV